MVDAYHVLHGRSEMLMADSPVSTWRTSLFLRVFSICSQVGLTAGAIAGSVLSNLDAFGVGSVTVVCGLIVFMNGQIAEARLDLYHGRIFIRNFVRQHDVGGGAVEEATVGHYGLQIVTAHKAIPVLALQTANYEASRPEATRAYHVGTYLTELAPRLVEDDTSGGRIRTSPAWPSIVTIACLLATVGSALFAIA